MGEQRYPFEEVPEGEKYWFIVPVRETAQQNADTEGESDKPQSVFDEDFRELNERMKEVRCGLQVLEGEWWPTVYRWVHSEGDEYLEAPRLYTDRLQAEEEVESLLAEAPGAYASHVELVGESSANEIYDNYSPSAALWIDRSTLRTKLEDADFLCVFVDGELKLRRDFIADLEQDRSD